MSETVRVRESVRLHVLQNFNFPNIIYTPVKVVTESVRVGV